MCEYKDIDDMLEAVAARRERVQKEIETKLQNQQSNEEPQDSTDTALLLSQVFETTFCLEKFLTQHPNASYTGFTNFTSEELDELISLVIETIGEQHRGKKMRITPKGCLFLTLTYYSIYSPLEHLASITSIKVPTLQRIIKKVTNQYFPIFIKKFIPKELPVCKKQFINFPDAVGAVDSSTIEFYRPVEHDKMKKSWDAKNHINGIKLQAVVNPAGIAIHVNIDYLGSVHDKKLFDVSGVTEFLTVKRGVRLLHLPILADRGYIGIEHYYEEAIVQHKGRDKETIKRNNDIAKDRQIVERYFGRLKMSWGILSDGFRGEKSSLQTIVLGLTALTNYHIDQHPLSKSDAPDPIEEIEDDQITSNDTNSDEKQHITIDIKRESPDIPSQTNEPRISTFLVHNLEISNSFLGISNPGLTCHLNSVIQIMVAIPELVDAVCHYSNESCLLMNALRSTFAKLLSPVTTEHEPIDINCIAAVLGPHSSKMQDCIDTYEEIVTKLGFEFQTISANFDINDIFRSDLQRKDGSGEKALTTYMYAATPDVVQAFKQKKRSISVFITPPVFVINLCRMQETDIYKHYETKFAFPLNLDLRKISTGPNKRYVLFGIIAYADAHFIAFVKRNQEWHIFNDASVYKCEQKWIHYLEGGKDDQNSNILWKMTGHRLVARLLFYKTVC